MIEIRFQIETDFNVIFSFDPSENKFDLGPYKFIGSEYGRADSYIGCIQRRGKQK